MSKDTCKETVFRSLFDEHAERIRNFVYYKSGNLAQAEDLMQDAFVKLWENCKKVPFEKARSFLYTVANNFFLNQVEHKKVVLKFEQRGGSDRDSETPEYKMEMKEFKEKLEKAISNLPENERIVFLMNRIDKKKYREIAAELNISIKTVEKRMHKALLILRKIHKKV